MRVSSALEAGTVSGDLIHMSPPRWSDQGHFLQWVWFNPTGLGKSIQYVEQQCSVRRKEAIRHRYAFIPRLLGGSLVPESMHGSQVFFFTSWSHVKIFQAENLAVMPSKSTLPWKQFIGTLERSSSGPCNKHSLKFAVYGPFECEQI
jgi:hypothetical protein